MWTEQVHASRTKALARSKQPEQLRFVKDAGTAPNSKALPMVLATSVFYLAVWWSRENRKVGGPAPLSWLSQLFKRGGKRTSQKKSNSWKQQRPAALAALAAERRAQGQGQGQDQASKKSKKKKGKGKK